MRDSDCDDGLGYASVMRRATLTMPIPPCLTLRTIKQDLDIELAKPTRRALAPAPAAENSSDRSEDTGIEAGDGVTDGAKPSSRGKTVPRKTVAVSDVKTTSSGSDEESHVITPKAAKAAAKAAKKAEKAEAAKSGTEEVAVRQRPTNNQLL